MTARNDITGDKIQSKISNDNYDKNFDAIFRKEKTAVGYPPLTPNKPLEPADEWDEKRIDIIGSNGPTGEHYKEQK